MKSKVLKENGEITWALIFDSGDEVMKNLQAFAREHQLSASHFTAIGAFSDLVLGYFNIEKKDYKRIPITEQVELLSMIGDIALDGDQPKVHAHVVVGKSDGSAWGGHLVEAHARPTLEVILVESPEHLRRRFDPRTGLALIDLAESARL